MAKIYISNLRGGHLELNIKLALDKNDNIELIQNGSVCILIDYENNGEFFPKPIDEIDRIELIEQE
jgi:hypothetical protein